VAGLLEQRGDPLAEERVVVGDDHAEPGWRIIGLWRTRGCFVVGRHHRFQ
jgi:hypothetical protein